jgi:hypothetical protein
MAAHQLEEVLAACHSVAAALLASTSLKNEFNFSIFKNFI